MLEKFTVDELDFSSIETLDDFIGTSPYGSYYKSIGNSLYGFSHIDTDQYSHASKDQYGLTFFTRPQLNLSDTNVQNDRMFYNLLDKNAWSVQRFVRNTLDPRLGIDGGLTGRPAVTCPLVDEQMVFIPELNNRLLSMSGWPDQSIEVNRSKQGMARQIISIVDSRYEINENFDLSCSFRNVQGDILFHLFNTWIKYMANVFEGVMNPYDDKVMDNEIDYNTRIYRLVLDENKMFVKKIAATGASFPKSSSIAKFFDFSSDKNYTGQTATIDMTFECMGAMYNDPILILEFNKAVGIFNWGMRFSEDNEHDNKLQETELKLKGMVKIPWSLKELFNSRGYPRINMDTLELEWWISKYSPTYTGILSMAKQRNLI